MACFRFTSSLPSLPFFFSVYLRLPFGYLFGYLFFALFFQNGTSFTHPFCAPKRLPNFMVDTPKPSLVFFRFHPSILSKIPVILFRSTGFGGLLIISRQSSHISMIHTLSRWPRFPPVDPYRVAYRSSYASVSNHSDMIPIHSSISTFPS